MAKKKAVKKAVKKTSKEVFKRAGNFADGETFEPGDIVPKLDDKTREALEKMDALEIVTEK